MNCDRCDECGGAKTYANQACLPINGKVRCIDWCIHQIVAALNAGGVETVSCCCGHGEVDGRIDLADGRHLLVVQNEEPVKLPIDVVRRHSEPTMERGADLKGQSLADQA